MNQIVTDAVVLRRINYGEADRIMTLLTQDRGKVTVIAKGVRRSNSKLAGSIELFGNSQITYIPSKGDINMLISARLINNYSNIVKELAKTQLGYEVLKLINKTMEAESIEPAIYDLVVTTLQALDDTLININIVKFWFSLNFLELMGHTPNLEIDGAATSSKYVFDEDKMMFIENENGEYEKNNIKVFRLGLSTGPKQLSRIADIEKVVEKNLGITQMMLINTGFNPI